jgi:hypothetical protein
VKIKIGQLQFSDRLTELRSIDAFTVSRYRIAMRAGAVFPDPVVNRDTMEIVSGNHTVTAMLAEFGEDHEINVECKRYGSEAEIITDFTRHNIGHGRPLDGWTQRKIALALAEQGQSDADIAALLNVPVAHLQKWGARTVVVIGKDRVRRTEPIKGGVFVPKGTMTERQYERHADADIGMTVRELAEQLATRLENGWINADDAKEREALDRLRAALK